jgi:hypothetical protein
MRLISKIYRSGDNSAMFCVIRDTDVRQSEIWFYPADGREMRHVRTYEHARDASQKAATLADILPTLGNDAAWDAAVRS